MKKLFLYTEFKTTYHKDVKKEDLKEDYMGLKMKFLENNYVQDDFREDSDSLITNYEDDRWF